MDQILFGLAFLVAIASLRFLWDRFQRWRMKDWPLASGEITNAFVMEMEGEHTSYRLCVTYKFMAYGDDGPYTGEDHWEPPLHNTQQRMNEAAARIRAGQPLQIRYRADDPSVNRIDGGVKPLVAE